MAFILASQSPRRRDLLAQIGVVPDDIMPADIDETPFPGEQPRPYGLRIASAKAIKVAGDHPNDHILAADTVVACGRRILPKAEDEATARACLALLSGRRHYVLTAMALKSPNTPIKTRVVKSTVTLKRLSAAEIDGYIASHEWSGKAGGYGIQGLAARYIRSLSGSYPNVVGLPLFEVSGWLTAIGVIKP